MSPIDILPPAPLAMVSAGPTATDGPSVAPPPCKRCRTAPATSGYKTCLNCRAKRNAYHHRWYEKQRLKKATEKTLAGFAVPLGVSVLESAASGSTKRKAEEPLSDGSKRVKLTSPLQPQNVLSIPEAQQPPSPTIDDFMKFTWATGLYAELQRQFRARSTKKMFRFRATHSIIADPKVNQKRRARQVERDLQQQTELQFDIDGRVKHRDENAYTITHRCTCLPHCTGVIVIHVADDNSHPLGLPGQRIKLTVVHPKRAKLIPSTLPPT